MDKSTKGGFLGGFLGGGPDVRDIFLGKVKERTGNIGVGIDEATIEVTKAKERLEFFEFLGLGLVMAVSLAGSILTWP